MNKGRGGHALAALRRAAKAVDESLNAAIREIDRGFLPDKAELRSALSLGESVESRVLDFASEMLGHEPTEQDWPLLLSATLTLGQLEDALRDLREAVSWSARSSGFNWWLRRRMHDLGQEGFIVIASPGSARDFVIEQKPRLKNRFDEANTILALDADRLEQLARIRILTVPHNDGSKARWHPISLGHEIGHLLFGRSWVEKWLASQPVTGPTAVNDAIEIAQDGHDSSRVTQPAWYTELISWLSESACDAAVAYIYRDEGIACLQAYLDVNSAKLDKPGHPSPDLRIAALAAAEAADLLARFQTPAREGAGLRNRKQAYAHLVIACREAVFTILERVPFNAEESSQALADALRAQAMNWPPRTDVWSRDQVETRPTSLEAALVRSLWSEAAHVGERATWLPSPDRWRALDVIERRVDHAVDYLQFAQRFYAGSTQTGTEVRESPISSLWISAEGVRTSPPMGRIAPTLQRPTRRRPIRSLGSPAFDVRLGRHFIVFRRNEISTLSALESESSGRIQERVEVGWGERFVLHPGEMVLAVTLEQLIMDDSASAQVLSRSSIGRMGLLSATAVHVQPGFRGALTLELVNLASVPLAVSPGQRIAQIVPMPVLGQHASYGGKYQDQDWLPRFSAASEDWEMPILHVMQSTERPTDEPVDSRL